MRISHRASRQFPPVNSRHADVGDDKRQARFVPDTVETFVTGLCGNDVISAIEKQLFHENADPIIILDHDQHAAHGSIEDGEQIPHERDRTTFGTSIKEISADGDLDAPVAQLGDAARRRYKRIIGSVVSNFDNIARDAFGDQGIAHGLGAS